MILMILITVMCAIGWAITIGAMIKLALLVYADCTEVTSSEIQRPPKRDQWG